MIVSATGGRNNTTRYTYNSLGWLTAVHNPLYNITEYHYDPNGNQVTRIAANNLKTKWQYDELNRLIKKTDSLNNDTFYSYDPVGNRSRREDPRGTSCKYGYLHNNLLQTMILTGKIIGNRTTERIL